MAIAGAWGWGVLLLLDRAGDGGGVDRAVVLPAFGEEPASWVGGLALSRAVGWELAGEVGEPAG